MQAVQMSFPHQTPVGNGSAGWRPAQPRGIHMGWRPARPQLGQQGVSVAESARAASGMLVGLAAAVSGGIIAFGSIKGHGRTVTELRVDPETGDEAEVEIEKMTWKKAGRTMRWVGGIIMATGLVVVAFNFMKVSGTFETGPTTVQR